LDEKLRYFFERSQIANRVSHDEFMSRIRNFLTVIKANSQAMIDYVPKTYPGKILFFRAGERDTYLPTNPALGWLNLAAEEVSIHEIPGNHTSMNFSPNVEVMADLLKVRLQSLFV